MMLVSAITLWALLVVGMLLIWAMQRRLMYFPTADVPSPRDVGLTQAEPVAFRTADDVTLHGWFLPAPPRAAQESARFTIVVFNGNAGNRAYRAPLAAALRRLGHAVLLFDYRGFGENSGAPTEAGLLADARAARAFLLARPDIDASRIIYFGESLGTAVAVRLAAEHPPAALILRSPFASMTEVARLHYPLLPVRWLLRDRWASIDRITQFPGPLLIIAGTRDSIVPLTHSRDLFDASPSASKQFVSVADADHNDAALVDGPHVMQAIASLLDTLTRSIGR